MRSDDLAPLLRPLPAVGVGFRQGTVVAWDPDTADNVIEVGGGQVVNLTTLNSAEIKVIQPGDRVSILTLGEGAKSWFVLGRITVPGGAELAIVQSANYNPGNLGYSLFRDGSAEFQDVTARGDLSVNTLLAGDPAGARVELTPTNFMQVYDSTNTLVISFSPALGFFVWGANGSFVRMVPDNGNFQSPRLELKPQPDPGFSTTVNQGGLVQASGLGGLPRLFLTSPIIDGNGNTATVNIYSAYSGNPDSLIFLSADQVQIPGDLTVTGGQAGKVIKRGRRITNSTATSSTTEQGVLRVDNVALKGGRLYRISTGPILVDGSVANDICRGFLRVNNAGTATTASTQLAIAQTLVPNISFPECITLDAGYVPAADETLSVLLSIARINGTGVFQALGASTFPIDLYIVDCGVDPGDTGIDI